MAHTPKQNFTDEEQEGGPQAPGAPTAPTMAAPSIGNTASVGGTVSGNSAAAPKSQVQGATAGTGFVNIDKYLGANTNAGADLEKRASEVRDKDAGNFNKVSSAFNTKVDAEDPGNIDVNGIVNGVLGRPASSTPTIGNPSNPVTSSGPRVAMGLGDAGLPEPPPTTAQPFQADPLALSNASAVLSDAYEGPNTLDYNVGGTDDALNAKGLSNGLTAGKTLAAMSGPLATYSTGLNAIDDFIYGNSTGSTSAIGKANTDEFDRQGGEKKKGEQRASAIKGKIQGNADQLRTLLTERGDSILSKATGAANSANSLQEIEKNRGPGDTGSSWVDGGQAQSNQFLSGGDITGLNNIGKLLGINELSGMKAGDKFNSGYYQAPPKAPPPPTAAEQRAAHDTEIKDQYRQILAGSGMDAATIDKIVEITPVANILDALSKTRTVLPPNAANESDWVQG